MVRKGYSNISHPEQLNLESEASAKKSRGRYISIAEVITEAVREFQFQKK